jgi:hypothetical protein
LKSKDSPVHEFLLSKFPGTERALQVSRSNKAAKVVLVWLKGHWAGRAASYRNDERTNRLLRLYVRHQRHADDLAA